MKITAERVLATITNGAFDGVTKACESIVTESVRASRSHPAMLGSIEVTGPITDKICNDAVQTLVLISLLCDEVEGLRREVKALRKACTGKKTKTKDK